MQQKNNKPVIIKQGSLPKIRKIRELLIKTYPKCFVAEGEVPKPLKIGIGDEIYNTLHKSYPDLISRRALKFFLSIYTASPEYISAMVQDGAMRIGLNGIYVEPVSKEDQEAAKNNPRKVEFIVPKENIQPNQNTEQKNVKKIDVALDVTQKTDINDNPKRKILSLKKKVE